MIVQYLNNTRTVPIYQAVGNAFLTKRRPNGTTVSMPEGGTANRRLSVSRFELGLFTVFLFLAVFHIPVVTFGGDSIGLFDLYLVA
jgi:hypothetical protein